MTLPLGLTPKQWERLEYLLVHHHRIVVSVQLLDLSHNYLADVSLKLLGGQVSIDAQAEEYTRALSMELLDPKQELVLDGDAPEDGSIYYTRMFRVVYSVLSPDRSERFDIPIFCGPVTKAARNGPVIACEAVGKDKLSMSAVWRTKKYTKGMKKETVIRKILVDLGGEASKRIDIVNRKSDPVLGGDGMTVNRNTTAWKAVKKVAKSMGGAQAFYDGRGTVRVRDTPATVAHVFTDRKDLLSYPQVSYDAEAVVNAVDVTGAKVGKKEHKHTLHYRAVAPRRNALSPWSMGRNGKPRYLPEYLEDGELKTMGAVRSLARRRLKQALIESVDVQFECLPMPHLEEMDLCRVESKRWSGTFRLHKMTIPLTADGRATVGYLRQVTPNRRQIGIKNITKKRRKRAA